MQLISIDQLKQLASKPDKITEAENSFSYDDFKNEYAERYQWHIDVGFEESKAANMTYYSLKESWLKEHCPPIKFVGEGSSRAAFACDGGKCLKVAKTAAGKAQNKTEYDNIGIGGNGYQCFPLNYAVDDDHWGSMLTECCSKADDDFLKKLYGFYDFCYIFTGYVLSWLNENDFYIDTAIKSKEKELVEHEQLAKLGEYQKWRYNEEVQALKLLKDMKLHTNEPKFAVLNDLVKFYIDHGRNEDDLIIEDLEIEDNWGLAIRKGQIVPIVIDAGFSDEVSNNYY